MGKYEQFPTPGSPLNEMRRKIEENAERFRAKMEAEAEVAAAEQTEKEVEDAFAGITINREAAAEALEQQRRLKSLRMKEEKKKTA